MASKLTSRWADDEETAEQTEQRRREKEEKRRRKEEKRQRALAPPPSTSTAQTTTATDEDDAVNGDSERPPKRRRTSDPESARDEHKPGMSTKTTAGERGGFKTLEFPSRTFAPCRSVAQYDVLNSIEEGSYGTVSRARLKSNPDVVVALKRLKMDSSHTAEGFPVTGLREIATLMSCRHEHIIHLREVVMGESLSEYVCSYVVAAAGCSILSPRHGFPLLNPPFASCPLLLPPEQRNEVRYDTQTLTIVSRLPPFSHTVRGGVERTCLGTRTGSTSSWTSSNTI